jgi:hypothetical protein
MAIGMPSFWVAGIQPDHRILPEPYLALAKHTLTWVGGLQRICHSQS